MVLVASMLASDYIVRQLLDWGVDTYFVLTGGAIAPFIDAIARNSGKYYCFQHEQAASMAADGYYRACGKIACVAVTSGPGAQNILNGLCGCWFDSVPALFITGQVNVRESLDSIAARPRQVGFQETPVVECFRPFCKFVARVVDELSLPQCLLDAFKAAVSGRCGPAVLDMPVNFQMTKVNVPLSSRKIVCNSENDATQTLHVNTNLLTTIQTSQRPLLIIGNGARRNAKPLLDFAERAKIPFVLTWAALDLVNTSSSLYLGTLGVYGGRVANFAVQNANLIIALGARLDSRQTGGNPGLFSICSKKIVVDVDVNEITKLTERGIIVEFPVVCDVHTFMRTYLLQVKTGDTAEWLSVISSWQSAFGYEPHPGFEGYISPYSFFDRLNTLLPSDAIVAVDTGATLVWTFQTLKPTGTQRVFSNLANSSMGYALPAAIGAALAEPSKPVFCIIGDGGMQQNVQELATARRYLLNVKVIVVNNSGYGIIHQFQDAYLDGRQIATTCSEIYGDVGLNFVAIAEAYSIQAFRVCVEEDVAHEMLNSKGLALFDVIINERHELQPKLCFGNSLCNMSPFIDSAHAMLVPPIPRLAQQGWKVL